MQFKLRFLIFCPEARNALLSRVTVPTLALWPGVLGSDLLQQFGGSIFIDDTHVAS